MEYTQKSVRLPRTPADKESWKRVIIVLEHCPLQSIQTDKGFELLSDRHRAYHARHAPSDPSEWRPDVVHQCLLHLQDSALNRAGKLEVFLRTKKGVCISVDPRLRIPRHMHLFEKMMVTLLFKMKVRSSTGYLSLLRVVKNPITDHFPANTKLFRVEKDGERIDNWETFCAQCCTTEGDVMLAVPPHPEKTTVSSSSSSTTTPAGSGGRRSPTNSTSRPSGEVEEKMDGEEERDSGARRSHSGTRPSTPPSTVPVDDDRACDGQKRRRSGPNEVEEEEEEYPNDSTVGEKRKKRDACDAPEAPEKEEEGKQSTTAAETSVPVEENPVEALPAAGTIAFADLTREREALKQFRPFAFIVGGMSKGDVTVDYASEGTGTTSIRLGNRGMSAAAVVSQLLYAFEEAWLKEDNALA